MKLILFFKSIRETKREILCVKVKLIVWNMSPCIQSIFSSIERTQLYNVHSKYGIMTGVLPFYGTGVQLKKLQLSAWLCCRKMTMERQIRPKPWMKHSTQHEFFLFSVLFNLCRIQAAQPHPTPLSSPPSALRASIICPFSRDAIRQVWLLPRRIHLDTWLALWRVNPKVFVLLTLCRSIS